MNILKTILIAAILIGTPALAGNDELIAELKPLLERRLIGTRQLKLMQQGLLHGELINPVQLGVGPEPELLCAHDQVQFRLDNDDIDQDSMLEWLNTTILARESGEHSAALKVAHCLSHSGQAVTPYHVIRHVGWLNLEKLMRVGLAACGLHGALSTSERVLTTSCSNTAIVLPLFFLGLERARQVVSAMRHEVKIRRAVVISEKKEFKFRVMGLYEGLLPSNLCERLALCEGSPKTLDDYVSKARGGADDFEAYLSPFIRETVASEKDPETCEKRLQKLFRTISYAFNLSVIQNLREEVKRDLGLISKDNSVLYVFFAKMPSLYVKSQRIIQHAFLVELFLMDGRPRFRLYQSWVNHATLFDNFKRQRFANQEMWDIDGFQDFVRHLEAAYCTRMDAKALWNCFGYGQIERITPLLTFEEGRFSGVALSYIAVPFNPNNVVAHLSELINCGLAL